MWPLVYLVLLLGTVHTNPIDVEVEGKLDADRTARQIYEPVPVDIYGPVDPFDAANAPPLAAASPRVAPPLRPYIPPPPLPRATWSTNPSVGTTTIDLEPKVLHYQEDRIEGMVKITYGGITGRVCETGIDQNVAHVMCKMIATREGLDPNFMTGVVVPGASRQYGVGAGPIILDDITCAGNEDVLDQCRIYSTTTTFQHCEQAGIICRLGNMLTLEGQRLSPGQPVVQAPSANIRLVGSTPDSRGVVTEGRVEVKYRNQWWSVCDDGFTNLAARVACRSLGFMDGQAVEFGRHMYGKGHLPILLDNLECTGTEPSLHECRHAGHFIHDCDVASEIASVTCSRSRTPVRPRPANPPTRVSKRDLLSSVASPVLAPAPPVSPPARQVAPPASRLPVYYPPPPANPPAVQYFPGIYPLSIRLFGGLNEENGMIQIEDTNKGFLTLCADGWTSEKARVVCSTLGYMTGEYVAYDTYGNVPADLVTMTGCDPGTASCLGRGPFLAIAGQCFSGRPASARCDNYNAPMPGDFRLAPYTRTVTLDGPSQREGIVYIQNDDMYGTVCNINFDDVDAYIVCRELGFRTGVAVDDAARIYGAGMGRIWLRDVSCSGLESHLSDCPHSGYGMVVGCDHTMDAGVRCEF